MKKTLIAMGVLGAFSSLAFAASNVTLYGVIEEGVMVSKAKHKDTTVQMKKGAVAKFTEFQRVLPAPLLLVNLRENCF